MLNRHLAAICGSAGVLFAATFLLKAGAAGGGSNTRRVWAVMRDDTADRTGGG